MAHRESAPAATRPCARGDRRRGVETLEFTFVLLPLLAMSLVTVDIAWAVWAKSTLQRAVRVGVRSGIALTQAQMASGACLTDTVKKVVQDNSLGLLKGASGLALIKVHYINPPAPETTDPSVDVTLDPKGNAPGNILKVSVENFSLVPLVPLIFNWSQAPAKSPMALTVNSADLIEPSRNPPCKGVAP